ncbi:hypothetical protein [Polaromonas sp. CG9_12]|nr:hypothetical protein [Polaromonas sp. CG9_12]
MVVTVEKFENTSNLLKCILIASFKKMKHKYIFIPWLVENIWPSLKSRWCSTLLA